MTSIRHRLVISLLTALVLLWISTALVFVFHVRSELDSVLDQRLAASARMVQRLMQRGNLQPGLTEAPGEPAMSDLDLPTELACQLWTREGDLLSISDNAPVFDVAGVEDGFTNRNTGDEYWRMYVLTNPDSGVRVITAEQIGLRNALLGDIALAILLPLLFILPLIAVIVWFSVGRGLAPLNALQRALRVRNLDTLDPLPMARTPEEVKPLVTTLNDLLSRLGRAIDHERRFIGDAAHELRTPLAALKTRIQVAQSADNAQRNTALRHVESDLDRMTRLINQMLELSRLDEQSCHLDTATSDPWETLREVAKDLASQAEQASVKLRLHCNGDCDRQLPLPPALLHIAVRNLVENAINHSPSAGIIDLQLEVDESATVINVIDQGPGIPSDKLDSVRERFYRNTSSSIPGAGLGLPIVAAVLQRYGGELQLMNRDDHSGHGLIASLHFQVSQDRPTPD